ncbi:MAG: response regulator [Deltaproteobacteria bacterium]|nr:response regulator [Deltaproteobacteria bacterium]
MPKKILLVDNQPLILELMSSFLEKEGHEVRVAKDGLSALDVLEGFVPDIMFVDLVMPNISGDKLCRIVRSMPHLREVFIVILSAIASEGETDFLSYGADACIAKGSVKNIFFHVQELIAESNKRGTREWEPRIFGLDGIYQREVTKELLRSQRHLELVLDHMSEGVVHFTSAQKIIYVNASAIALFGQPEEKLLGTNFFESLLRRRFFLAKSGCCSIFSPSRKTRVAPSLPWFAISPSARRMKRGCGSMASSSLNLLRNGPTA